MNYRYKLKRKRHLIFCFPIILTLSINSKLSVTNGWLLNHITYTFFSFPFIYERYITNGVILETLLQQCQSKTYCWRKLDRYVIVRKHLSHYNN